MMDAKRLEYLELLLAQERKVPSVVIPTDDFRELIKAARREEKLRAVLINLIQASLSCAAAQGARDDARAALDAKEDQHG